jgi:hypothetical protein
VAGPNSAEALPGANPDPGTGRNVHARQDLAESRAPLRAYETRLENGEDIPAEEVDRGRYWLYEHLQRLGLEAGRLLDKFERDADPPILLGNTYEAYIRPLLQIYDDLLAYFWNPQCLMKEFAADKFDTTLDSTIGEVRENWEPLINAIKEYLVVRQEPKDVIPPERYIVTGREFHETFAKFVKPLVGQVTRDSFKSQHSRLAQLADFTPPPKRGRVLKKSGKPA